MSLLKPNNNEAELTEEFNSSNRLHTSSLTHSTSSSPTTKPSHPSTTQQQHHHDNDEVNCDDDDTMKCLGSINPDPWITMEPGKQQQRKDLISKCKRSLSSELDTNKLKQHPNPLHHYPYHHGFEFPTNNNTSANNQSIPAGCGGGDGYQKKTGVEPCCLDPPTSKTVVITSDMHKLKASTITTPSCTISLSPSSSSITTTTSSPLTVTTRMINWKTTTSSSQFKSSDERQHDYHTFYYGKNENQKLWKPRRLHFVLRLPIIGTDPHVLLIQIIELIKRYQCSYEFLSSYRIRCTKLMNPSSSSHQPSPCSNDNNNNNTIDDVDVDQQLEHCTLTTSPQQNQPQQQQQQQPQVSYLIHLKHKTNLIIWDMEIFQLAKPINYGVRFKRISGNRNAFNIIMKYFILHTTNIT
ncbi:unnamed protein product [Schistosoma margrebowiei]|uniref:Uncharacterized protein n=1 Tax=Schistosoma margrebowiei TaxID=48269 RepID=A0AA84ZDK9_9TREM|nr:unnamed protein product [Schistosoma margrebowiei]